MREYATTGGIGGGADSGFARATVQAVHECRLSVEALAERTGLRADDISAFCLNVARDSSDHYRLRTHEQRKLFRAALEASGRKSVGVSARDWPRTSRMIELEHEIREALDRTEPSAPAANHTPASRTWPPWPCHNVIDFSN